MEEVNPNGSSPVHGQHTFDPAAVYWWCAGSNVQALHTAKGVKTLEECVWISVSLAMASTFDPVSQQVVCCKPESLLRLLLFLWCHGTLLPNKLTQSRE